MIKRIFAVLLVLSSILTISGSVAQASRAVIDLRTGPIINSNDVSNLALVLSVEFPTTGAAYKNDYVATTKYLGYFDAKACYRYNHNNTATRNDDFFERSGANDANYYCNTGASGIGNGFSGNYLNYALTSSIDILRFALTGGDRVVDEAGNTILQRAVLTRDGDPATNASFYANASNFPTRTSSSLGTAMTRLTPFTTGQTFFINSCQDEFYIGSTSGGSCTTPNADRTITTVSGAVITSSLKARVKVCDATEGPVRTDMCQQYPDGNYKPVGEIQKNANKVRVAAFGYLLPGNNDNWYGGVLRAPMKFAGPEIKDPLTGLLSPNTQAEWSSVTGVYTANPMADATFSYSGVINYLNRFGRSGQYKRHDPVGELYYESVRYFQGLQPSGPTPNAYSNNAAYLDGFPTYPTWTDPMQNNCQRNYSLTIGDHQSAKDGELPGSDLSGQSRTFTPADVVNAKTWTDVVTSFETNGTVEYFDAMNRRQSANGNATSGINGVQSGNTNLSTKFQDGQSANGNNVSYLWAGVAYWANTQQIRSDKPQARIRSYVIDVNEGNEVSPTSLNRRRALYLAGKYGGFADVGLDGSTTTGDGNPFRTYATGTLTSSNEEWLAADGSNFPLGYFLASQPDRLVASIKKIFAEAARPSGTLAGGSLSVSRLNTVNQSGSFYQAKMNPQNWTGTVVRTELTFNTVTSKLEIGSVPIWDAANILTGVRTNTSTLSPFPLPANRKIYTFNRTTAAGVTFTWNNLETAVQTSLKTDPATGVVEADSEGQKRLDYIRGDRTNEQDFRARSLIMGDIINSAPLFKGGASTSIVDTDYRTFYTANKDRTPTVYVGANDGMLHAFRAAASKTDPDNGKELFAYIPRAVATKLNKLTNPAYGKEAYVDASGVVDEAKFYRPSSGGVAWGTVLASGMGGGAQGLFALDVTDPTAFSAQNALWEFTDADDPEMGNIIAEPKIVKLAVNGVTATTPVYKWFVLATSGYNNYQIDGNQSSDGRQLLFLISLEKAPADAWQLGTNYYKMRATDATFSSTTLATGMGMPGVAIGRAGNALYAYAGDLQGNLWRFDLTGGASRWTATSTDTSILFIAKNSTGTARQPITVVPFVTQNVAGGYQVTFGTGKFIEPNDALSTSAAKQALYGVWDAIDKKTVERGTTGSGAATVNGLISRTLTITSTTTTTSITIAGPNFSYGKIADSTYRGWYVDFTGNMERVAVDPVIDSGLLAINSTIPGGDPCVPSGSANQYRMDPRTGRTFSSTATNTSQGYLGGASILEVGDALWLPRDHSGRYQVWRQVNTASPSASGGVAGVSTPTPVLAGRMSWREITNFQ
jgi:type IV pilus assembly protein PilY1